MLVPMLVVGVLVLLVHAFIVTNAQAEAEVAASAGLRAAWRSAANDDFLSAYDPSTNQYTGAAYGDPAVHPRVLAMAAAALDAAARAAATDSGWRWWTPGATTVYSDWCFSGDDVVGRSGARPGPDEPGWVRVEVHGDVFGPLAALWPGRLDRVYAAATGPAVLRSAAERPELVVPADLAPC